jgi:D-amino-acid dehydrogenase
MMALNGNTVRHFDELRAAGIEFEMNSRGLLIVGRTFSAVDEVVDKVDRLRAVGYDQPAELVSGDALRRLEPAVSDAVAAGLHLKGERSVRPEELTAGLANYLTRSGAEVKEHAEVSSLSQNGRGGWYVRTAHEELYADRVLVAAGIWSKALLRKVGLRLALEGARGDSVTAIGEGVQPRHALDLSEAMVACTPFSKGMRLTSNYNIGNTDEAVDRRRLEAIIHSASHYLRDWTPVRPTLEWAGIRPVTPDDLPFIGQAPGRDGLYVATGHGELGVTLGPATAEAITQLILEGQLPPALAPFQLDRMR